jgi:hypothetical protein
VRIVSVFPLVARAAYGVFFQATEQIETKGTFDFAASILPYVKIDGMFK